MTTTFKPLHPTTLADPFAEFARLRESAPVHWYDQLGAWVLSRHADCHEVLRNSAVFARDPRRAWREMPEERRNIQTQDPPEQLELRQAVMRALHSQDIAGVTARAATDLRRDIERRSGSGPFNLMEPAAEAAITVINSIVGSVEHDVASYAPIFRGLTRAMDSGIDPSRLDAGRAAGEALSASVRTWFTAEPRAGMIATLQSNPAIAGVPEHYVHNTMGGVFNAGFSTLYASTGSIVRLLLQRRDVLGQLTDEVTASTGVHELLRFTSPAQATSRFVVSDTEIGGVGIPAGSTVVTLLAAANRDPLAFDRPDDLVVYRSPNPHLAFAWGPHVCLGAQLATAWAGEVVRMLRDLGPSIALAEHPSYLDSATLRTLVDLPVVVR